MRGLLFCWLLAAFPAVSLAEDVCTSGGLMDGPLGLSFFEGDSGCPRRVCPRTEVTLDGSVMGIDVADDLFTQSGDFYATIAGGGGFSGSWKFSERGELFASFQVLNVRFVQNATITGTRTGIGWFSAGATYQGFRAGNLALAMTARLTLPTAFGYYEHAWPLAADFGVLAGYRPLEWLGLHGQLGVVSSLAMSKANPNARAGLQIISGVEFMPLEWLGVVLDLGVQLGYAAPVDMLHLGAGFRFRIWRGLGVEIGAMLPCAGETKADLAAALRIGYRFDY